jgi:single-strand DNA-binding protein
MEQLNRIEIRGNVGAVRLQEVGNSRVAKISVATNYVYKGRDGDPVIETTWHYISAWEGKNITDLSSIRKGDKIYVAGRLRSQRYIAADGTERSSYDVLAYKLQVIDTDEALQYEL